MWGIKLKDRVTSKELRERLGLDDIISLLKQNRLQWYGHVLRKKTMVGWRNVWSTKWRVPGQEVDQSEWVSEQFLNGTWAHNRLFRPKKTWRDCAKSQACKLNRGCMDRNRWRKQIWDNWWSHQVWAGECFFWYWLNRVVPDKIQRAVICVYVCATIMPLFSTLSFYIKPFN